MKNYSLDGEPLIILLVEDNRDHAELVKRNLLECRVVNRIHHVEDGEAALYYLHNDREYADCERFPSPHLVLLDLRLPKIDGIEVLKTIKSDENLQHIPVVILTTSDAEADLMKAYSYHANSFLVKPVVFDTFASMLRDLGYYWLAWNRRPWQDS